MYVQKRYFAGATVDTYKLHTPKCTSKNKKRAKKEKPTSEIVEQMNELLAHDKYIRKMNANFTFDDLHIILTFEKLKRPPYSKMQKIFKEIITKARKEYRKNGLELKWMVSYGYLPKDGIEEYQNDMDKFEHKETAPHFHLVVNYIDIRIWTKIWSKYGRAMIFPLDKKSEFSQLAKYMIGHAKNNFREKNSPVKQRYSCSRNLINPPPKKKTVKADSWREEPIPLKGYYIDRDSIRQGVSEVTGYPYQFCRMIKINPRD